jgi:hypothetical protein
MAPEQESKVWIPSHRKIGTQWKPDRTMVGLGGFEPPTSPLSGVRSNQLSYRPGVLDMPAWLELRATDTRPIRSYSLAVLIR